VHAALVIPAENYSSADVMSVCVKSSPLNNKGSFIAFAGESIGKLHLTGGQTAKRPWRIARWFFRIGRSPRAVHDVDIDFTGSLQRSRRKLKPKKQIHYAFDLSAIAIEGKYPSPFRP